MTHQEAQEQLILLTGRARREQEKLRAAREEARIARIGLEIQGNACQLANSALELHKQTMRCMGMEVPRQDMALLGEGKAE